MLAHDVIGTDVDSVTEMEFMHPANGELCPIFFVRSRPRSTTSGAASPGCAPKTLLVLHRHVERSGSMSNLVVHWSLATIVRSAAPRSRRVDLPVPSTAGFVISKLNSYLLYSAESLFRLTASVPALLDHLPYGLSDPSLTLGPKMRRLSSFSVFTPSSPSTVRFVPCRRLSVVEKLAVMVLRWQGNGLLCRALAERNMHPASSSPPACSSLRLINSGTASVASAWARSPLLVERSIVSVALVLPSYTGRKPGKRDTLKADWLSSSIAVLYALTTASL